WAFLEVATSDAYNDSLQAYAAGLAEAAVSEQLIYMHWMNTVVGYCGPFKYETDYCEKLQGYLEANLAWMQEQMEKGADPEYWHQVRGPSCPVLRPRAPLSARAGALWPLAALQHSGLALVPAVTAEQLLQLGGDLEDLESAFNRSAAPPVLGSGSCSALLKLLPGNRDLLVAHDTWTSYQSMLRVIKKYTLPFRTSARGNAQIPGSVQVFSSYPGTIFSGDDFYILSSGLVSRGCFGGLPPVANRLARSGAEWAALFQRLNSGTYNNQWMVVDYKAFSPGAVARRGVLTVLEQIPRGLVVVDDKTELLYQQGYWASYNVPYFEEIFNASGNLELVKKYGDWFSYDGSPRARIFQRNQTLVRDMDSMVRLMRFNNYLRDPLSRCQGCDPPQNAENAISARSDLNPANGTYPFPALRQRSHGGTDMKITSFSLAPTFRLVAASGPTWDDVPPFQWS
ncbi:Putative phospholipase B-like 2, partial [Tinamus guttatus]